MRYLELVEGRRPWRRYHPQEHGYCSLVTERGPLESRFDLGIVTTGRSEVFVGTYVRIISPDGQTYLAEDPYSLVRALRSIDQTLFLAGWLLNAIGTDPEFYQTGLTDGSAWGYHPEQEGAVHILASTPDNLGCDSDGSAAESLPTGKSSQR